MELINQLEIATYALIIGVILGFVVATIKAEEHNLKFKHGNSEYKVGANENRSPYKNDKQRYRTGVLESNTAEHEEKE